MSNSQKNTENSSSLENNEPLSNSSVKGLTDKEAWYTGGKILR